MTDILERLAGTFRAEPAALRAIEDAAAEIERLRAGGCARDQGTTQYCAEAAKLAAENEKLRAALGEIIKLDDEWVPEAQDDYTYTGYQVCADIARAALEVSMTDHRSCTCHPDEAPIPCQRGYALSVCQMRAVRTANEEIIALRAENERQAAELRSLRAALRQVAAYKADDDEMDWADAVLTMNAIARAALEDRT